MTQTYFLGANSKDGFYSLYGSFPPESCDFLHIIKSGPGTGKSGFMRKIGAAAEKRGLDVQYVLCSGDPDSIDGVYIPALKTAWVDGTAPHVCEPEHFGINSDYINLGKFCKQDFSPNETNYVNLISQHYKSAYSAAYTYLSSAASLRSKIDGSCFSDEQLKSPKKRIDSIIERNCRRVSVQKGRTTARFLSAISCKGEVRMSEEIYKLCKLIYQLDNSYGGAARMLEYAASQAEYKNLNVIRCLSPLEPDRLEALILPQLSLAFTDDSRQFENAKHIRIDALIPQDIQQQTRQDLREIRRINKKIMELAFSKLSQAKQLHDELEEIYKAHMDFTALNSFTEAEIKKLFKQKNTLS